MKQGKTIDNQLIQAIKDSRFFIIVFSKNYASSSWCLDELVEIMDCQKTGKQTAYPVFFHVEPTHVRKQSGAFGEAFSENKNKDAAGKWIEALKGAANVVGRELQATANGHEAKFIKKIVGDISLELRSINSGIDEGLVGMETRVNDVVSSLEIGSDEVRMIGIKGMGGAGKTTTARAVFDHLSNSNDFDATSFVKNVREVSNGSDGLKKLQEQVLFDMISAQVTLHNVDDGKDMMKKRMCGKKVLLVLDDVDHIEQLKALAGERKWFKSGSRILITTRDEQVLKAHRLVDVICDIALLSDQEATSLFSRYAFGKENPLQGYEALSENVVRYAAGLPLTVTVLGSFLCEDDYKEIFLDIACILNGERKEDAIRILESCGFHARNGLKVLEQRSLITIKYGSLGMHDHIEEMGKNIVRRSHSDEPKQHSRLWIDEEIEDLLANDMGTKAIRCLKLHMSRGNERIAMKGFGKMKKLRYLEVDFPYYEMKKLQFLEVNFSYYKSSPPNSLKYLKIRNYPFLYLPKIFQANNLVGLDMDSSNMVKLWEDGEKKVLKRLKFLSLYESNMINFDFRITPNLVILSLGESCRLKELFMPVCCQKLNYLHISHSKLITFDLGLTPNLETLDLSYCREFVELHVSAPCPNLKSLSICGSNLRSLDLQLIPNLESLDLHYSIELVEINAPVGCLKKVGYLNLCGCVLLEKLPEDLGRFGCLIELDITDTCISHLPESIFGLKGLRIHASSELLQLYDFPSEITTTTEGLW
nr:Toll/interleukin-1 receptor (TIR) domain-containing protein [Tanacetum cinerariifolium]